MDDHKILGMESDVALDAAAQAKLGSFVGLKHGTAVSVASSMPGVNVPAYLVYRR